MGPKTVLRLIFWIVLMAYCGSFVFAGRGVQSLRDTSYTGAFIGGVLGLLIAIMFARRARRRQI